MSYERIKDLVILGKQGDKKALEELIITYQKLIGKYTATYFIKGCDDDDIEQIANMAVVQAVQKYDISKGGNFTAFLNIVLRNTFTTMINKKENTVNSVSLNNIIYDESDAFKEYIDILVSDIDVEEDYITKERRIDIINALNTLSKEEKQVLLTTCDGYGGLRDYAKSKGKTYASCRYQRIKVLDKIKKALK